MQYEIKHRFSRAVLFTAEIAPEEGASAGVKLGLAVKAAIAAGASLADANLADANFAYANLTRANLAGANLAYASLTRANLTGANLAYASLPDANLADADLTGAYLARANLTGANLTGTTYGDEPMTKAPISLSGFAYPVTILDTHAQIGCQFKSFAEWLTCDRRDFAPFKAAFEAVLRAAGRWPLAADDESA